MTPTNTKLPLFFDCPKKHLAREHTIIEMYRNYCQHSVPKDRQYWTMCGPHTKDNVFQSGSELGQLLESKLIEPYQFHGVDIKEEIINSNKQAKPEVEWIYNDFFRAMREAYTKNQYNPAIINADFISMSKEATSITSDIMDFIEYIDCKNVMLISNIMLTNPHARGGKKILEEDIVLMMNDVIHEFEKLKEFRKAWATGNWEYNKTYVYKGTGNKSRTIMGSFIFIRRG